MLRGYIYDFILSKHIINDLFRPNNWCLWFFLNALSMIFCLDRTIDVYRPKITTKPFSWLKYRQLTGSQFTVLETSLLTNRHFLFRKVFEHQTRSTSYKLFRWSPKNPRRISGSGGWNWNTFNTEGSRSGRNYSTQKCRGSHIVCGPSVITPSITTWIKLSFQPIYFWLMSC